MENALCPVSDCQIPVDVVLRSSDKVLVGAHKTNLDHYSDGFPPAEAALDSSEPVDLTENGATLRHLMQYVHKQQYPNIFDLQIEEVSVLADAAEKYMIHPAMGVCATYMQAIYKEEPVRVLAYAAKHYYLKLCDKAAPLTLLHDQKTMKDELCNRSSFNAWLQYKIGFIEAMGHVAEWRGTGDDTNTLLSLYAKCDAWKAYSTRVIANLYATLHSPKVPREYQRGGDPLQKIRGAFQDTGKARCGHPDCACYNAPRVARLKREWEAVTEGVYLSIGYPAFSSILSDS